MHKAAILSLACNKLSSRITLSAINSRHNYGFSLVFVPLTHLTFWQNMQDAFIYFHIIFVVIQLIFYKLNAMMNCLKLFCYFCRSPFKVNNDEHLWWCFTFGNSASCRFLSISIFAWNFLIFAALTKTSHDVLSFNSTRWSSVRVQNVLYIYSLY